MKFWEFRREREAEKARRLRQENRKSLSVPGQRGKGEKKEMGSSMLPYLRYSGEIGEPVMLGVMETGKKKTVICYRVGRWGALRKRS